MSAFMKKLQYACSIALAVLVVLAFMLPTNAEAKPRTQGISYQASTQIEASHVTTPALRTISPMPATRTAGQTKEFGTTTSGQVYKKPLGTLRLPRALTDVSSDPGLLDVPEKRIIEGPMPGVDVAWEGLSNSVNRLLYGYGVLPPDTIGAASDNHYIQTVNNSMIVFDLHQTSVFGGTPLAVWGPGRISSLFAGLGGPCATFDDGDPIVFYDQLADRWVVTQFAISQVFYFGGTDFYECIAVSSSDDPLGTWNAYAFPMGSKMNDYPKFGVWPDGYYMSVNQFDAADSFKWAGAGLAVFDSAAMQAGTSATMIYFDTGAICASGGDPNAPICLLGGMLPSDLEADPGDANTIPPAGTPNYFVQFDDDAWGVPQDQLEVWEFHTNWATPASTTLTYAGPLAVAAFDSNLCGGSYGCIAQPGTTNKLDAISDRLMNSLKYRYFGGATTPYGAMVTNHTIDVNGSDRAGIRWYELRDSGAGWGVYQQGNHSPDTRSRWMGSIAMDKFGNMSLGYSLSDGVSTYPSIAYAGRRYDDPLGKLPRTEVIMTAGKGSQLLYDPAYPRDGTRWGDYSQMDVAPDGCGFFYTNEYYRGSSDLEWTTRIGAFAFDLCLANDATGPTTTLVTTPTDPTTESTVHFEFTGDDGAGVGVDRFMCSLDGSTPATCTSPATYVTAPGAHTFSVYAVDKVENKGEKQTFTWNATFKRDTFTAKPQNNGWILESTATSNKGGTVSAPLNTILRVGDDKENKQYRSILGFNTAGLPDRITVLRGYLLVKMSRKVGATGLVDLGDLRATIRRPYFGAEEGLVVTDFQSFGVNAGLLRAPASGNWYRMNLLTAAFAEINVTGTTQFKLSFAKGDNANAIANLLEFFSGNTSTAANRPVLVIEYIIP